ncbi:PEGA domain-containing protein [Patescibacteria group bacterium]
MRKKILLFLLSVTALVSVSVLYFAGIFKSKSAGLLINTSPSSVVFVNGEQVGTTPYDQVYDPGETEIKLVPESFETPLTPYETKVVLVSGIQTIIERDFSDTQTQSSGETVSFEKGPKDESSIVVISDPDGAQVEIDGMVKGFTPYKSTDITEDNHSVKVSANDFHDRTTEIVTKKGYKLTLYVKLAENGEQEEPEKPPVEDEPVNVRIIETPTGFLRVREEASTSSSEVARVNPDDVFEVVEESEDGEWVQIQHELDEYGWVSKEYTKDIEENEEEDGSEDD